MRLESTQEESKQDQDLDDDRGDSTGEGATEPAVIMLGELAHQSFRPIHYSGCTRKS
jgi:hypothetical protein